MACHLTEKGRDLLLVLIALLQWGDRWLQTPDSVPIQIVERDSGQVLEPMRPRNRSGKVLSQCDLDWVRGPGSTNPRIAPLVAAYEKQRPVLPRPVTAPKKIEERRVDMSLYSCPLRCWLRAISSTMAHGHRTECWLSA